jgi:hypothetical protein
MPPTPAVPGPHLEVPNTLFWEPGAAAGQNKLTSNVHSEGKTIALQAHDVGTLAVHVAPSLKLPITLLFASRKMNFSAHTVKMNGTSTGVSSFWAPTPMSVCSMIVPSLAIPVSNVMHGVNVGMTVGDMIAGYVSIALTIVANITAAAIAEAVPEIGYFAGQVCGATASLIAGAVQIIATGEGTVGVTIGSPPLAVSGGVSRSNDGTWSIGGSAGPWAGKASSDGSTQTTAPADGPNGSGRSVTTTKNPDGSTQKTVSDPDHGTQTSTDPIPGHSAVAPSTPRI